MNLLSRAPAEVPGECASDDGGRPDKEAVADESHGVIVLGPLGEDGRCHEQADHERGGEEAVLEKGQVEGTLRRGAGARAISS